MSELTPFGEDRKRRRTRESTGPIMKPGMTREERQAAFIAAMDAPKEVASTYAPHYSTAYAKDLARERGWRVIQSEYRDHRGNLRDVAYGSDVMCQCGNRLIFIQASCPGQRAEHWRRFQDRTEEMPMGARFLYIEFARDGRVTLEEEWTK